MTVLAFLVLALLLFQAGNKIMMYWFLGFAVLALIFYPFYLSYYYKKHYQDFVTNSLRNRFNQTSTITLNEHTLDTADDMCESKIKLEAICGIIEIGQYFYLKIISGETLIIPKFRLENADEIRNELQILAAKLNLQLEMDLNWKWK